MTRSLKIRFVTFMAALALLAGAAPRAFSQEQPAHAPNVDSRYEHMDAPETHAQEEQYRHSKSVQFIAKVMHTDTETAAKIFEDLNSAIIWIGVIWLLVKVLPKAFRARSEKIQKELVDAHSATEEAKRRLSAVEARLARLDSEIEAIRKQAEHDSAEDEKRIKASLEEERKRIVESAEQEIEAFGSAAQRELKRFAAELAVDRALQRIHLGADADRILVQEFTADLAGTQTKGGQN
ncbi:ATP synthase F0 subunit B [Alloacidobacterium dinghuense]|uniref:ATP synthase subunit b n=1 Tax=Alloacidobacterium dinghuense TaxID=2763107 RepID=A0A7G8BHY3_9BACT|nr:ATP synthase F0 subunit B [Alloacidobacterium dinghuense]QNI32153.1 ATP synthase F0 subunit B [Alloacidobacterium dinghuense]